MDAPQLTDTAPARGRFVRTASTRYRGAVRALLMIALVVACAGAAWALWTHPVPGAPHDAFTYLAAGERLNAGHALYALTRGDRPVEMDPPYWTVPLLSPPFIAVLWRPLAALPGNDGAYLWWVASIAALILVVLALVLSRRPLVIAGVVVLGVPVSFEMILGNVDPFLVLGMLGVWLLAVRRHDLGAGALVALMAALKLYPGFLIIWFIAQRRWDAVTGFLVSGAACLGISIVGAGLTAHLTYVTVVLHAAAAGTDVGLNALSLDAFLRSASIDRVVGHSVVAVVGTVSVVALRRRPAASFSAAVATLVFASPVLYLYGYTLLLGALVPLAFPEDGRVQGWLSDVARLRTGVPAPARTDPL